MIDDIQNAIAEQRFPDAIDMAVNAIFDHELIDVIHAAGIIKVEMRQIDDGMLMLKTAAALRPGAIHIYTNAAAAAERYRRADDLEFFCTHGLAAFPDDLTLRLQHANVPMLREDYPATLTMLQALPDVPHDPRKHIMLGMAYRAMDSLDEAAAAFDQAAAIAPDSTDVKIVRAGVYRDQGQNAKAIALLDTITHHPDGRFMRAIHALADGQYEKGWYLYHDRWGSVEYGNATPPKRPLHQLRQLRGKSAVVMREGGHGDVLMIMRYLSMLLEYTPDISLQVARSEARLAKANLPGVNIIVLDQPDVVNVSKRHVFQIPMMDLPYFFNTRLETIPAALPYIRVSDEDIAQHRLPETTRPRIGLCWAGGPTEGLVRNYDKHRSMPVAMFDQLKQFDADFYSLQLDKKSDFISVLKPHFDWFDTAAIIAQLDLVISVDTAIVHLAAAMGRPTWVLSRFDPCWRWLRNQPDSPWYPNVVRVFGQTQRGVWDTVLTDVKTALGTWLQQKGSHNV